MKSASTPNPQLHATAPAPIRLSRQGAGHMKLLYSSRCALSLSLAVATLAGCGGSQSAFSPAGALPRSQGDGSLPHSRTFHYTGKRQEFTVPAGVKRLTVVARGAKGAGSPVTQGGRVYAVVPVTPGEKLVTQNRRHPPPLAPDVRARVEAIHPFAVRACRRLKIGLTLSRLCARV
jgi:hypothetical protein